MTGDREFVPLRRSARTGGSGVMLLGIFAALTVLAVVARATDRSWWVTPAVVAAIVALTAPVALWLAWREGVGQTLRVRPDVVELVKIGRRRTRRTVVRRDAPRYAAVYASVQRGPDVLATDPTLLIGDGTASIRLVEEAWGRQTLRDIAAALGVRMRDEVMTRAEIASAVERPRT
jgi:hypothetical protein